MTVTLGLLLLLLLGAGVYRCLSGRPSSPGGWLAFAGYAVVLGLIGVGFVTRLPSMLGIEALPAWRWAWPALPALLAWAMAAPAARLLRARAAGPAPSTAWPPASPWLLLAVLTLLAVRLVWIIDEAWLRPLFGWDAWLAWSAKAKAWSLAGEAVEFAPAQVWLEQPPGSARISLAHHYPELLSWIEVWLASLAGGWRESAINLAWPALWLAMLAGCAGQWRVLGASPTAVALGAYALGSLPLLTVHAALPGYADMWVATCLAFAVLSWLRWMERGERGHLLLALVLLAVLPALKFEGMVWALGMIAVMLWFGLARHRAALRVLIIAGGAALVVLLSWLCGLQWLETLRHLMAPAPEGAGRPLGSVLLATAAGLFAQGNWHLLWYLLPLVLVWRWRRLCSDPPLAGATLLVLAGMGLILGLFVFTQAGRWAESYTVVNRLVMHLAPTAVALMVLASRPARQPVDGAVPADAPAKAVAG
ncbi:MAG: hypothetical protein KF823_10715 [Xanthomonadales bacterium]|nr:hypothetical protein [Xanthomonadales bacterium]